MNIWKEIEELEASRARVLESQDRILDVYDKNNSLHSDLLKQTTELKEEYDNLIERYKELAKEC